MNRVSDECEHLLPRFLCRKCSMIFSASPPHSATPRQRPITSMNFADVEAKIMGNLPDGVKKKVERYVSTKI